MALWVHFTEKWKSPVHSYGMFGVVDHNQGRRSLTKNKFICFCRQNKHGSDMFCQVVCCLACKCFNAPVSSEFLHDAWGAGPFRRPARDAHGPDHWRRGCGLEKQSSQRLWCGECPIQYTHTDNVESALESKTLCSSKAFVKKWHLLGSSSSSFGVWVSP